MMDLENLIYKNNKQSFLEKQQDDRLQATYLNEFKAK